MSDRYRGWWIQANPSGPVTGRWVAFRHGVRLSANDRPLLLRMIDLRIEFSPW